MAITRAQIPEQVDLFDEGGGVGDTPTSLSPEDIIALYNAQQSAPITTEDIQTQAEKLAGLFPQQRKQNIFDLASEIGAGLVAGASDPRGFGAGLTAGLKAFNQKATQLKSDRDKIRQQITMLAFEQVKEKRAQQEKIRSKAIDKAFDLQIEQMKKTGQLFGGTSTEAGAWNYILSKIDKNTGTYRMIPDGMGGMKPYDPNADPYFRVAKATLEQAKTELRNEPGVGQVQITTPGFDVDAVLDARKPDAPIEAINALRNDPGKYDEFVEYYGEEQVPIDLRKTN